MKKSYQIYLLLIISVLLFSSCEKGMDTIEADNTVYLPMSGLVSQTVLLGESIFELGVYKAGINQEHADVTVSLKVDEEAFNELISSNPAYKLLPEAYYSIVSENVTIHGDEERQSCQIHLKGIGEDFADNNYILPVSIESVSPNVEILEEQKTVLLNFTRYRNAYECLYKAYGSVTPSGSEDASSTIDEQVAATTISPNAISVVGAEGDMDLVLTISEDEVNISGGPGSEAYNITHTEGKTSTYKGSFDPVQQCNTGTFNLFYTYLVDGQEMNVEVELKFWL